MNGTVAKASYTATVTPAPVDPVKPEEPAKPEDPTKPENSAQPEEPVKPAEPAKPVVTEPEAHKQTVVAPAVEKTTQIELPNTGTVTNTVSAVFAVVLVAGGLYLVRSNKMRNIAKTILVLGGLGTFFAFQGEVLAADSSILGQIIEQMNLDPEEIDCYDYVGFYISEETTTAGPTTTVVTTEATTTTETTTERTNNNDRSNDDN